MDSVKDPLGNNDMTWILAIWSNPLARKITVYAAIALAILYGLRLWGNKQWAKGELQGRQHMARDLEKQKQKEWNAREAEIKKQSAGLAEAQLAIQTQAEQIAMDRANLSKSLAEARARIQRERETGYATAAGTPDSRIWDDIRAASTKLATDPR